MWGGKQLYALIGTGAAGAALANTTNAALYTFTIPVRSKPVRVQVKMTVAANGASSITFTKTSAGDLGTLTLTATNATIGKVMYETTSYTTALTPGAGMWLGSLAAGDRVVCATTSSDSSGYVIPMMILEADPETPGNDSNMVAA